MSPILVRSVTVLGSTGSVGTQTVELLAGEPRRFRVRALVAGRNATLLAEQAIALNAERAVISDPTRYQELRQALAGTGVTVALLCPGPVRTEFLKNAGMDERALADAFPKFLWMASRDVARTGVDALDGDRGTVIAGPPSQVSTRLFQFMPRRLLLPLLAKQHPGLRRDRSAS